MLEFFKPYKITTVFLGARIALKYFILDLATGLLEPVKFREKKCESDAGLKVTLKVIKFAN